MTEFLSSDEYRPNDGNSDGRTVISKKQWIAREREVREKAGKHPTEKELGILYQINELRKRALEAGHERSKQIEREIQDLFIELNLERGSNPNIRQGQGYKEYISEGSDD